MQLGERLGRMGVRRLADRRNEGRESWLGHQYDTTKSKAAIPDSSRRRLNSVLGADLFRGDEEGARCGWPRASRRDRRERRDAVATRVVSGAGNRPSSSRRLPVSAFERIRQGPKLSARVGGRSSAHPRRAEDERPRQGCQARRGFAALSELVPAVQAPSPRTSNQPPEGQQAPTQSCRHHRRRHCFRP